MYTLDDAAQNVEAMEDYLGHFQAMPETANENALRMVLEEDSVKNKIKELVVRFLLQNFPHDSRYIDGSREPMFDVGKLQSSVWAFKGCFGVAVNTATTEQHYTNLAVSNHSSLPEVLNTTIAAQVKHVGLVRWSSTDTILVLPVGGWNPLTNDYVKPATEVECSVKTYTGRLEKNSPPVEWYERGILPSTTTAEPQLVSEPQPPTPRNKKWMILLASGVLVALIIIVGVWYWRSIVVPSSPNQTNKEQIPMLVPNDNPQPGDNAAVSVQWS